MAPTPAAKRPTQTSLTNFFAISQSKKAKTSTTGPEMAARKDDSDPLSTTAAAKLPPLSPSNALDPIVPVESFRVDTTVTWKTHDNAVIYRTVAGQAPRSAVAGFGLDGTLMQWRIAGWPSRLEHYELWNASVITQLQSLYDSGYKLVVFSNQGAIRTALGGKKASHVKTLVDWLASVIDRPLDCLMSTDKKTGYHKPSLALWKAAERLCNNGQAFDIAKSFYVGDSIGGDDDPQGGVDAQFAKNVSENAGVTLQFHAPPEYFGPSSKELRSKSNGGYQEPPLKVLQERAALVSGYTQTPILLLLCGVQGSGKSTFCEKLGPDWVHLSQDTIKGGKPGKREQVEAAALLALQQGKSVVVDRMHLDPTQRAYFIDVAQSAKVTAHAVVLSPPKEVVAERVRNRTNHAGGVEGEKGAQLAVSSMDKLVWPKYDEGLALISGASTNEGMKRLAAWYRGVPRASGTPIPTSFELGAGIELPSITLGTMGLGRKVAEGVVADAIKLGFRAFDTAPTYKNEDKVGPALAPASFCIVKVPKRAASSTELRDELSKSLSQLQRLSADLLLLHWPSDAMAAGTLKEVWQEMEACQKEGLAKAIGVCNFNAKALSMLLALCNIPPAVNQVERHPLLPQWDLVDFCAQHDILLQAHTPLGQGKLIDNSVVEEVATAAGCSVANVLLGWNLQQGVAVVPKCSSEEHMTDVLSVLTSPALPPSDMQLLNELAESRRLVQPPFMYGSEPYCWAERPPKS